MFSTTIKAVNNVISHNVHPTGWVGDEVAWVAIGVAEREAAKDTNADTCTLA